MSGLLLILTGWHGERADAALELAATLAAMGRPVGVFLQGAAVRDIAAAPAFATLLELGVEIMACQTSLAAAGLDATTLPAGVEAAGMVAFLQGRADWRLLLA